MQFFPTSLFKLSSLLISLGSLFLALCLFSQLSINISWHLCCTITSTKENFLAFISFIETNLSFENIIANVWNNSWEFPQSCLYLKYFSETYVHVYLSICHIFLYRKLWINIYINISCKKINYFSVLQICLEKIFSLPFEHVNYWQMDDEIYLFDLCRLRYFYWCAIYLISLNLDWVYVVINTKSSKSLISILNFLNGPKLHAVLLSMQKLYIRGR